MGYLHFLSLVLILLKGMNFINVSWVVCFIPIMVIAGLKLVIITIRCALRFRIFKVEKEIEKLDEWQIFTKNSLESKKEDLKKLLEIFSN